LLGGDDVTVSIKSRAFDHYDEDESRRPDPIRLVDPIEFRVQRVEGGSVVETSWYDDRQDENIKKLHIITDDQEFTTSIAKIVTMELLKR